MRDINVEHKNITILVKRESGDISVLHRDSSIEVMHPTKNVSVDHTNKIVNLKRSDNKLNVSHPEKTVSLYNGGKRGVRGIQGEAATIEVGSTTTGEPSTPAEVTNVGTENAAIFDFVIPKGDKGDQGDPGTDGDKNYTETFPPTDNIFVTHNLGKYPAVTVINSAGDEVVGEVNYLSTNTLIVSFSAAFGGRVTCN